MEERLTIYTAGYMRSGNNWLCRTLSDLFCAPIVRAGGVTQFAAHILDGYEIKMTHWDRKQFNEKGYPNPVVHMARDPRDMAVSLMYYHGDQNLSHTVGRLVEDDFAGWVESWMLRPTNLNMTYEVMHDERKSFEWLKRIYRIVTDDAPILHQHIADVIERQNFSNWMHLSRKINRRGKTGDWKNHFNRPLAKVFEQEFGWVLRDLDYERDRTWWTNVRKELPCVTERNRSGSSERPSAELPGSQGSSEKS